MPSPSPSASAPAARASTATGCPSSSGSRRCGCTSASAPRPTATSTWRRVIRCAAPGCSTARSASGWPCATCWTGDGTTRRRRSTRRAPAGPTIRTSASAAMPRRTGCDGNEVTSRRATPPPCTRAEQQPGLVLVQAVLASDAAEAGHRDVARAQLDRLAADDYAAAGRQWMAVLALGHLAWATVTIEAARARGCATAAARPLRRPAGRHRHRPHRDGGDRPPARRARRPRR